MKATLIFTTVLALLSAARAQEATEPPAATDRAPASADQESGRGMQSSRYLAKDTDTFLEVMSRKLKINSRDRGPFGLPQIPGETPAFVPPTRPEHKKITPFADIIAAVLFGDGAAAACLSTSPGIRDRTVALGQGHQILWPDTLDIMGWDVDDTGLGVVFDRSIPAFVTAEFAEATKAALKASRLDHDQIDRYVCHPGGARVVDAIEGALHLPHGSLQADRDTQRVAGNMSAPTVMFVMQSVIESGQTGQMMACALGPGFTASFLPFQIGTESA